ncbi:MAG: hypothetical protein HYZ71_05250 [Deltaproteobacteria bacterium]|nr:hypothetical protein [Deltaproteobacteria bacterium]
MKSIRGALTVIFMDNSTVSQILDGIASFRSWIIGIWWLWMFPLLFLAARSLWLAYVREWYRRHLAWSMFELKIPREILRSPRAMEQVLASIYALINAPGNIKETWWDGEVTKWSSLELVSFGGEIRFFMRATKDNWPMVQAALYSHYPDLELVEISEEEDYIHRMPPTADEVLKIPRRLFGSESILDPNKSDVYPIRTYIDFEESEEDFRLDTLATMLEVLGKCGPQEELWLQILIRPVVGDWWKKEGEAEIEAIKKRNTTSIVSSEFGETQMTRLYPGFGDAELIKGIDKKIAKPAFESVIRYLYMTAPEAYNGNFARRGIASALNQHMSKAFNQFDYNKGAATRVDYHFKLIPPIFPKHRYLARQRKIYRHYRERYIYPQTFAENILEVKGFHFGIWGWKSSRMVLNTEELATIYHLPTKPVMSSQLIRKVEARKIGPPMGLAIYGEEGERADLPGLQK